MKFLIRRIIFWGLVITVGVGAVVFITTGPEMWKDYVFQEGPRYLDGTPYRGFNELFDEPPVFVIQVYWQADCQYCKQQLELMNELHKPPLIFVVAINIGDSQNKVEKIVHSVQTQYPVLLGIPMDAATDSEGRPLQGMPYNVIIRADGEYAEWYGYGLDEAAEEMIIDVASSDEAGE